MPKLEDAKAPDKKVSNQDMKAASNPIDRVLEFSRIYFGEADQGEGFMVHTWSGNTDSRPGTKPRREADSPVSNGPFAAWGEWPSRGIAEFASPLAD